MVEAAAVVVTTTVALQDESKERRRRWRLLRQMGVAEDIRIASNRSGTGYRV